MTTPGSDDPRRALADPAYRPLWDAARARLERNGVTISNRPVMVDVTGEARRAIAGLTGRSPAGTDPLAIRLDRLDEVLRNGAAGIGLVALLEQIDGPVVDRRAVRARRRATVSSSWAALTGHPATRLHPGLDEWLEGLRASGSALRTAGSLDQLEPLVRRALDVTTHLPADHVPLAVFAAQVTGDAHALDRSTPLGSLVTGALDHIDAPDRIATAADDPDDTDPTTGATRSWRDAWARVGVVCDDVSPSVLVLNLVPVDPDVGPVAGALDAHRRAGLPLRLTLRQLRAEPLRVPANLVVHSCENPSVVAHAAATLGDRSAPLICTDGQPNSAVDELIGQLTVAGVTVRHHGDFDWGGIAIANTLIARHRVEPWRFTTSDYLDAADRAQVPLGQPPNPVTASWDTELVPTMRQVARCLFEEQVIDLLLDDLRDPIRERS